MIAKKKKIKLQTGDIISFELDLEKYGFARVLTKTNLGDAIDVYDYFSNNPNDYKEAIKAQPLFEQPVILDGYSLFWKRLRGNWELMERDENFIYGEEKKEKVKFKYGSQGFYELVDLNGTHYNNVSQEEAEKYPNYSPYGDLDIKRRVDFLLNKS
jgi:hypothetical protein